MLSVRGLDARSADASVMTKRALGPVLWAAVALGLGASRTPAQSLTRVALSGSVRDSAGRPLDGAIVVVTDSATGTSRRLTTPRAGGFTLPVLLPGVYTVAAERLGYRPVRVRGVALRPGRSTHLDLVLSPVALPVRQVTERRDPAGIVEDTRPGTSQGFPRLALADLPGLRRDVTDLGRLASTSTPFVETEGLPTRLSGFMLDRVPYAPARHPALMHDDGQGAALPLSSVGGAELVTGEGDVEWSELAGARFAGELRRGGRRGRIGGFAEGSTDALSTSDHFDTGSVPHQTWRAGLFASGPIVRDTAFFAVGVEYQRRETPWPAGWTAADSLTAGLVGLAQDSFGVDIAPYAQPRVSSIETGAAFGRIDLLLGNTAVTAHATAAKLSGADPDLGPRPTAPLGAKLVGMDFAGGLTVTSALSPAVIPELSVGYEASEREYRQGGAAAPATTIAAGGLAFGGDPALPARFEHHTARASLSLGVRAGRHRFKIGGSVVGDWTDEVYAHGRAGEFFFTDSAGLVATRGVFTQTVGALPVADYSRTQFAVFFQDWWTAAPGFEVQLGARVEFDEIPVDEIRRNDRWLELTGLDNTAVDEHFVKVSPRVGFRWDIGRGAWLVRGGMGIYHGLADRAVLAEWLSHTGAVTVRRGVGDLDAWPDAPDSVAAPVQGPWLTLLEPEFQGPLTARFSLGVSRPLDPGTILHLAAAYRHTDFLPRRSDLNRPAAPATADQYDRPVYGTLVKEGGLLAAAPGSNRRFPEFDLVAAVNPDGSSNYWGLTVSLERQVANGLGVVASYTWSRTRDNWLSGRGGFGGPDVQLSPFPDSVRGLDWSDGRSDFDQPHRAVVGLEYRAAGPLALRVAALYRYQSGYAFTPGFRDGVDANADGSARNDPAFVDEAIPGMDTLLAEWDCLREQVGRFAARNSCREPAMHALDVRLAMTLARLRGSTLDLFADGINLIESDVGIRDRALYLVDAAGSITTDPGTGRITVPLVANPGFGKLLVRRTNGRFVRLGVRVNY